MPTADTRTAGRIDDFARDEDGAAMVEFVLVAPILCYLMVGIFFFHHHIDYAQDSIVRFRALTWKHVPPKSVGVTDQDSDRDGFTNVLAIRTAVQGAPALALSGAASLGGALAAERYYGGDSYSPYGRLKMPANNYWAQQEAAFPIPRNPWADLLAGLGGFFGNSIGGGSHEIPTGYDVNWEDKYPLIVNPWMRYLNRSDFTELCVTKGMAGAMELVMQVMDGTTCYFAPIPNCGRSKTFSDVHKVDSALDDNTRQNECKMKSLGESDMKSTVQ